MKKVCVLLLAAVIALLCASCSAKVNFKNAEKEPAENHDAVITKAIEELRDCWKEVYKESQVKTDGHFEIKNTRMITVKDNDLEIFDDIEYIIEFELYTDYRGSAPYYENVGINNTVVVYKNGKMAVESDLIRAYRSKTYQTDYSDFIQAIDDYHGYYNCTEKLR